jgi:hypothetical protein
MKKFIFIRKGRKCYNVWSIPDSSVSVASPHPLMNGQLTDQGEEGALKWGRVN